MASRRWLAALALLGCAPVLGAIADRPGQPQVRVEVTRSGAEFIAELEFDRPVEAWGMPRSDVARDDGELWRPRSWTVETRGVRLQHIGHYDVLTAARGELPLRVRVRVKPFGEGLRADYAPALVFTDGAIALFVAQFEMFPMDSLRAVRALPSDLNNQPLPAAEILYVFRDPARPVLLEGKRARIAETRKSDTYVFFGDTRPLETPHLTGILDPQLPPWIRESLSEFVPALMTRYTQELGPLSAMKPTLFVSWAGPTPRLVSRGGSVLRGMIVMTYEGEGVLTETTEQRQQGLWFIAHEAAHFWLGQTAGYEYARDAWITEGGAELLAIRAVAEIDPAYDPRVALNKAIADCASLTQRRGVAGARERGEDRAYYACGAVFGLLAESGSGRSFSRFVRRLIDENRADGVITRAEWLAALDTVTRRPALSRGIARLLDRGASDPREFLADLLLEAGADIEIDAAGMPRLQ